MTRAPGALQGCTAWLYTLQQGQATQERQSAALYLWKGFDSLELHDADSGAECFWLRIRGKEKKAGTMVGVSYRPPSQGQDVDEIFCKQLGEVRSPPALVVV